MIQSNNVYLFRLQRVLSLPNLGFFYHCTNVVYYCPNGQWYPHILGTGGSFLLFKILVSLCTIKPFLTCLFPYVTHDRFCTRLPWFPYCKWWKRPECAHEWRKDCSSLVPGNPPSISVVLGAVYESRHAQITSENAWAQNMVIHFPAHSGTEYFMFRHSRLGNDWAHDVLSPQYWLHVYPSRSADLSPCGIQPTLVR